MTADTDTYCDYCGQQFTLTRKVRRAWEHCCPDNHDIPDFEVGLDGRWWVLKPPKRVRLTIRSCGCAEVVDD